jgi:hypothetical protein
MKEKIVAGKCGGIWGGSALSARCIFVHTFSHLCTFSAMKLFPYMVANFVLVALWLPLK